MSRAIAIRAVGTSQGRWAASRARYSIWQGNARSNSVAPSRTTTMHPLVITVRDAIVCTHEDRHLSPTGC
jgi:hypothetical protein